MSGTAIISIVICTYNRADILAECLDSLCRQTISLEKIPVIVVDNNSSDNTKGIVEAYSERLPCLKYHFESEQGLSHARNRGYRETVTPWLAYLDDDAKAHANYVEKILVAIARDEFDCVGGVYLPWHKYARPIWYLDSYGTNAGKPPGLLETDFVSGGNMIIKRSVLQAMGGFSAKVGMSGKVVSYGEETRLQIQMRAKGYRIGFDPEIQIDHLVAKYKLDPWWFIRSKYSLGVSYWDGFMIEPKWATVCRRILNAFYQSFRLGVPKCLAINNGDYFLQNYVIDVLSPIAFACGIFVGYLRS